MSSRRSRSRQRSSPTVTDEQIIDDLVMKLRAVLPRSRIAGADRVSAATVLQETCDYIRSLQQEVGDLSERLSESLAAGESGAPAAAAADEAARIVRSLLMM